MLTPIDDMQPRSARLRSSAISTVLWSPAERTMTVTFVSGHSYTHEDVSEDEYERFIRAPSPGREWHTVFKGR